MAKYAYDLQFHMTMTVEATPETIDKVHDEIAKEFISAIDKQFGGKCQYIRDCKTGRFRAL